MNLDIGDSRKLIDVARKRGCLRNQVAYILATAYWETNHTVKPIKEAYYLQNRYNWSDSKMESWRSKNLRYYPYYGRGYVQLTWDYNYERADKELGLRGKLLRDLDYAMDPEVATQTAVVGMMEGWFTGKKLSDYITLQKSDFVNARRIINGTDEAYTIASIAQGYDRDLRSAYDWS